MTSGGREERGAIAIMTALFMTALLVVTALVLDFGILRVDRQVLKSLADSAAMSGVTAGDTGGDRVYSSRAVCGALTYVKTYRDLETLPDDLCATAALALTSNVKCDSTNTSTFASYDQTVTTHGTTYRVIIKSPYVLSDGGWSEEDLAASTADQSTVGGCDQLGVQIIQTRSPGLGSLATEGDLSFGIRSVARVLVGGEGRLAPALMLLERTACSVLTVGSAGAGTGTYINVHGTGDTPGSIHIDTAATGSDCGSGSNQQAMQGKQNDGIVAYGSPSPTGSSGVISSVARYNGVATNIVYDSVNSVYGTTGLSGTGSTKTAVTPRALLTRSPVDLRYRAGVRTAIAATTPVWALTSATAPAAGWTVAGCNPTAAQLAVLTKLWINCQGSSGITLTSTIQASEIFFNGFIKGGTISMPNATRVYVSDTAADGSRINSSAVTFSNGNGFCVRTSCTTACSATTTSSRARVFVRRGRVDVTGGTLRLCNSTLFLLGGDTAGGCVPTTDGFAPTTTPCTGTVSTTPAGSSQISVSGGTVFDWRAPNEFSSTIPTANQASAWADFEDLALWSESAGDYKFAGGGGMVTVGVYMVPNASPVSVGGGSTQTLINAQYIARTFAVSGGGTLSLTTDPRNVVTIPESIKVLVR